MIASGLQKGENVLNIKPSNLRALQEMLSTCLDHVRLLEIHTPKSVFNSSLWFSVIAIGSRLLSAVLNGYHAMVFTAWQALRTTGNIERYSEFRTNENHSESLRNTYT